MKRHFLALLLSVTMMISLLPVTAMADDEEQTPQETTAEEPTNEVVVTNQDETENEDPVDTEIEEMVANETKLADAFPDENFRSWIKVKVFMNDKKGNYYSADEDEILTEAGVDAIKTFMLASDKNKISNAY